MNNSPIYNKRLHINGFIIKKNLEQNKSKKNPDAIAKQNKTSHSLKEKQYSYKVSTENPQISQSKYKSFHNRSKEQLNDRKNQTGRKSSFNKQYEKKLSKSKIQMHKSSEKQIERQLLADSQNDFYTKNSKIDNKKINQRYKSTAHQPDNSQKRSKSKNCFRNLHGLQETSSWRNNLHSYKKINSSLSNKHKHATLFSPEPAIYQHNSPNQSDTKLIQIFNIYPKKSNDIQRGRKITVMSRYNFESENIRLAEKLLSMKPTRPCDKREQHRFFKKQQYFKQLRSCSIDFVDTFKNQSRIRLVSQSVVSMPRINQRYNTVEY